MTIGMIFTMTKCMLHGCDMSTFNVHVSIDLSVTTEEIEDADNSLANDVSQEEVISENYSGQ